MMILLMCIFTVFPMILLVIEHMFSGHNSMLQDLIDSL
jgi:hypothetical protein